MKKTLLILSCITSAFTASAQVSLNASHAPVTNSTFIFYDANVPNPAFTFSKSGTGNTWDFTTITITPGQEDTIWYLLPSQVAGSSNFSGATHAKRENDDASFSFLQLTSSNTYFLGIYGDVFNTGTPMAVTFPSPVLARSFPFTISSNGTGNVGMEKKAAGSEVGQPGIDSVWFKTATNSVITMMAEGNMVVPSGTFPAMLERNVSTQLDSLWMKVGSAPWTMAPGFPKAKTDSVFRWYSNQSLQEYAHVIYKNGSVTDVTYFKSVSVSPTGINETKNNFVSSLYPNPVRNSLHIESATQKISSVHILNYTGAEVWSTENFNGSLNVELLPAGMYLARVQSAEGSSQLLKFVKQ